MEGEKDTERKKRKSAEGQPLGISVLVDELSPRPDASFASDGPVPPPSARLACRCRRRPRRAAPTSPPANCAGTGDARLRPPAGAPCNALISAGLRALSRPPPPALPFAGC